MSGLIKGIFGLGSQQSAPAPVPVVTAPPPVIEDTASQAENASDELRRRKGRAATILSGGNQSGGTGTPSVGTKTLLGA